MEKIASIRIIITKLNDKIFTLNSFEKDSVGVIASSYTEKNILKTNSCKFFNIT